MAGKQSNSGATTGYEAELWAMADALRGSMDAAELHEELAEDAALDAAIGEKVKTLECGCGP